MALSNKIIRCHILDRKDQLEEALYCQKTEKANTRKLEQEVIDVQERLRKHKEAMKERQKHIDYLRSTMDIKWIENPPY